MEKKWQASPSVLSQELPAASKGNFQVTFVQSTSVADVMHDSQFEAIRVETAQ